MSREDQLTLHIRQMLDDSTVLSQSRPSIYRVSEDLRSTNDKAYDPKIIAIGPFHREKKHLKKMEHAKKRYLKLLTEPTGKEPSLDRYVRAMRDTEGEARKCYAEEVKLKQDEFVQMLLLDGVFIIELLREYSREDNNKVDDENNPIFHLGNIKNYVLFDLLLVENQIPLFILEELFNLSKNNDQDKLSDLIWPLLSAPFGSVGLQKGISSDDHHHHLLGLVHHIECSSFAHRQVISRDQGDHNNGTNDAWHINSATELDEAGIRFKTPRDPNRSFLGIRFKTPRDPNRNGLDIRSEGNKIWIPELYISDDTDSWFRNMIAYEYRLPHYASKYVTDYAYFMHNLIHSTRDAQLLRRQRIIKNWLGGDEMVYRLINQMGTNVQISEKFSYRDVFSHVNHHCGLKRNRWIATLKRDYFNSPWKLISIVAAIVLLGVGITQMVFAILSYLNDKKGDSMKSNLAPGN